MLGRKYCENKYNFKILFIIPYNKSELKRKKNQYEKPEWKIFRKLLSNLSLRIN